jgi:hypothetical protein
MVGGKIKIYYYYYTGQIQYFSVAVTRVRGAVPVAAVPALGKTSFSLKV